ncbi:condensation domain-containing protein [Leptospira fletcheri]|nr:condensation domain-containing protein [Leptospira fletcheri]
MKTRIFPASPNQIRHWRHACRFPESPALNMTVGLRMEGFLDLDTLRLAVVRTLERHDSLFAKPFWADGELYWESAALKDPDSILEIVRCEDKRTVLEEIRNEAKRPFRLEEEYPVRARIFPISEFENIIILNVHHISLDGWSVELLIREIATRYNNLFLGDPDTNPKKTTSFEGFSKYQSEFELTSHGISDSSYWKKELENAKTGVGFPPDIRESGFSSWPLGRMSWSFLTAELSDLTKEAAKVAGVTPFIFLVGAFARLLGLESAEDDVLVGVPFVNRLRPEDANLVGFVVNTLPLRFKLSERNDSEYIRNVSRTCGAAFLHQRLPYVNILRDLGPEYETSAKPVFRTMFILQGSQTARNQFLGLNCNQSWISTGGAKYEQTWTIEERNGAYTLDVEWNPELFSDEKIACLMESYGEILRNLANHFVSGKDGKEGAGAGKNLSWPELKDLADFFSGPIVLESDSNLDLKIRRHGG